MTDAYVIEPGFAAMPEPMEAPMEPMGEVLEYQPAPKIPMAVQKLVSQLQKPNLADDIDDETLAKMGSKVCEEFGVDEESRKTNGWDQRIKDAMSLAMLVKEEKGYPWPKASNIKYPTIALAAIQFNARSYPALVDGSNIVKGKVLGEPTEEKRERADNIGRHMSWQLLEEMDNWEEDTDRLLMMLPIVGCVFRKSYFDPVKGCNDSYLVSPDKFVVNYWAKDLDTAPRATQVLDDIYPYQVEERFRSGVWRKVDLDRPADANQDDEAPLTFLEQHRLWDLDDDGYPEPYVITVHKDSQKVVRVAPRYDDTVAEDGAQEAYKASIIYKGGKIVRIRPAQSFTKYGFIPAPDGSFYDLGFGTLLAPLSETINSTLNQLMDAGHLANTGGGFIGAGASLKSGNLRFQPGEWKKIDTTGATLRESIVPLPVREPSAVLFNLLGMLIEASKEVTSTQDILTGEAGKANMPVGTTLAMIEQGLKTFSAIIKRLHRALKHELGILYRLNSLYLTEMAYFTFQDQEGAVAQRDYAMGDVDVVPVSDPNMATDMQKMGRAQFLMQFAADPRMNFQEIVKRVMEAASIDEIDGLFAPPQEAPPDPKAIEIAAKAEDAAKQTTIDAAKADAEIAKMDAETQQIAAQTMMMGPEFMLAVQQMIDQRLNALESRQANDGSGPVQPGNVRELEGPPPDGLVPPVPLGLPEGIGPEVGFGAGDVPPIAADGQDPGGASFPPMG